MEALLALQRYIDITFVLATQDSYVHKFCLANNLPFLSIGKGQKEVAFDCLSKQSVDLVLSAGFRYILPSYILSNAPVFVNSHPSLLPNYKGMNAIKEAVFKGEEFMGVTVHYMVEDVDEGPFIHQEKAWVKGMALQEIYDLIFSVVEPMAISKAMEHILREKPE